MTAISHRGENLGKIARADDQSFIIEKGVFFPKDYVLRYEYITEIRGDQVIYALEEAGATESSLRSAEAVTPAAAATMAMPAAAVAATTVATPAVGTTTVEAPSPTVGERLRAAVSRGGDGAPKERSGLRTELDTHQELRMPLRDEEITVEKVNRETGHVRIYKAVRTEERHITVPVTREEVVVEHLPASETARLGTLDDPFEESTIDLTVHEEEVLVSKHPVLREEVLVRRVAHEEQRDAAASLRHEEIRVEDTTDRHARTTRKG